MLRRMWNSWGIQAKLLLSFLIVLAATVITSGVLFYLSSARAIERQTLALTSNTVNQMTKNVDFYVAEIERLSQTIFGDASVQRALRASDPSARERRQQHDVDEITYRMLTLGARWQSIQGMYIFANDGFLFYVTRGQLPPPGYVIDEEPWYARMRQQTAPAVLLWPTGAETSVRQPGQQVFSHIRLIKNISTGKKLGYLKIDLNVSVMRELLTLSETTARSAQVLLIADDGHVIYDSGGGLTGRQIDDLRMTNPGRLQGRLTWRDSTYLYAAQRSEETRWTTWVLIPAESVTTEARQTGLLVLALCVGAVMLIGAIVYVVTQRVTRPLRVIAQAMLRVEQGDLGVRVPATQAGDELGRLSRVFNTMLDSLERLITQVYQAQLREKDAQLLALQTQINPHFLFNTLNSIRALSRKQHADGVAAMAESLAEIFRYSMSDWNEPVPLHEELAHVANYVTIQRARFGDRFTFECAVPAELLDALVVKLSIQPLIENAITHGLDRRRTGLSIVVSACLDDAALCLEVADTGYGIDTSTLAQLEQSLARPLAAAQLPRADVGIGIVNIDRRIKLLFGEQYGVAIRVAENVGTAVSLVLPYRCGDAADIRGALGREHPRGRRRTTSAR
ncbi:MAG TPA: sensor histidine kinase [Roseiflexaceae bacterium]|nr:sensor histidine kinase [Roseiflexaceae bacterium]